jgi:hypothetical protein
MSSENTESLSDVWSARFDDRDDEDLACHAWAQRLAARERALAQPIRNFAMSEDVPARADLHEAANDSKPGAQ